MKKKLLSTLALGSLAFTSCSSDDDPPIAKVVATCNDGNELPRGRAIEVSSEKNLFLVL